VLDVFGNFRETYCCNSRTVRLVTHCDVSEPIMAQTGIELIAQGQWLEIVQRVLCHRDIRSTLGYAELQARAGALERPSAVDASRSGAHIPRRRR